MAEIGLLNLMQVKNYILFLSKVIWVTNMFMI